MLNFCFFGFFYDFGRIIFVLQILMLYRVKRLVILIILLWMALGFFLTDYSSKKIIYAKFIGKPLLKNELTEEESFEVLFSSSFFSVIAKGDDERIITGLPVLPIGTKFYIKNKEIYFYDKKFLPRREV